MFTAKVAEQENMSAVQMSALYLECFTYIYGLFSQSAMYVKLIMVHTWF